MKDLHMNLKFFTIASLVFLATSCDKKSTAPNTLLSEDAITLDNGMIITACLDAEGQGNPWDCKANDGSSHSCIKKVCDDRYCAFEESNLCYKSDKSEASASNVSSERSQTLPEKKPDGAFFFLSDIHAGREKNTQLAVRDAMEKLASQEEGFSLIINGGDSSDHGLYDNFLQTYITSIYQDSKQVPAISKLPIHSVLGNHDYCKAAPSQLLTLDGDADKMWRLDDLVWSYQATIGDKTLGFVHIDTNILAYYENLPSWIKRDCSPMGGYFNEFEKTYGNLTQYIKDKTTAALEAFSDNDYLFVVGHHPAGGGACGGEGNMSWLLSKIKEYKASAYLSGHVHSMDFGADKNTLYMSIGTSGTTAGTGCLKTKGWKGDKWEYGASGFGAIRIYGDSMYMSYYDKNGQELLTQSVASRTNK
jgi:predicted phosphodiesterase